MSTEPLLYSNACDYSYKIGVIFAASGFRYTVLEYQLDHVDPNYIL